MPSILVKFEWVLTMGAPNTTKPGVG